MTKTNHEEQESTEKQPSQCPICQFLNSFGEEAPKVLNHFKQARVEVLKGVRELIDLRIRSLEKTPRDEKSKRFTKVPVEES